MADKQFIIKLPKVRVVSYVDNVMNEVTNVMEQKVVRTDTVSAVSGLDMALMNAPLLVQEGHDFFDVQDLRNKIKKAFDLKGRHEFDDEFIIITEKQKELILLAMKKFDWTLKQKLPDGTETEPVMFWLDWFEFFSAVKNCVEHKHEDPDGDYATWVIARNARLAAEKIEDDKRLEEAARKKAEGASEASESTNTEGAA